LRAGVFDSGVGGLTVVKSLVEAKLFDEIIYFGDTARVPYGIKDANTVLRYSLEALEFFNNFDVDVMIIACNTASAYALAELQKQANFPVYGVIEPGAMALEESGHNHDDPILVIGTDATINSKSYQTLLAKSGFTNIQAIATPLFVPLVEEEINKDTILTPVFEHYFSDVDSPKALILGCTHFPLLEDKLQHYFGESCAMIHSGDAIVEYLKRENIHRDNSKNCNQCELKIFSSDNIEKVKRIAARWVGEQKGEE
jgi:glutamate racemase